MYSSENAGLKKKVVAAGFGNLLEWYDFGVYGFFAVTIGKHFFPQSDPVALGCGHNGAGNGCFAAHLVRCIVCSRGIIYKASVMAVAWGVDRHLHFDPTLRLPRRVGCT